MRGENDRCCNKLITNSLLKSLFNAVKEALYQRQKNKLEMKASLEASAFVCVYD